MAPQSSIIGKKADSKQTTAQIKRTPTTTMTDIHQKRPILKRNENRAQNVAAVTGKMTQSKSHNK